MDVSTLLTTAQTLIQLLDSSIMKEIEAIWSFKSQLTRIKETMSTIKAILLDAEEQERMQVQRSNLECDWLEKLRFTVYQADSLFDEVVTRARQQNLIMERKKVSKAVSFFLSYPTSTYNMSRDMKKIRKRLDDIAKDRHDFGPFRQNVSTRVFKMRRRRVDSHSFVRDKDVIGRDDDKRAVMDMLLDNSIEEDVSFVSIIGIGGLGKTTLAQLLYNDERIKKEFPLKLWVCISEFDVKAILAKIVHPAATKHKHDDLVMDELQSKFRAKIDGKKYFLVLDDMWNENRQEWLELENLLIGGGRGSRVLVTTRSRKVGKIIGRNQAYELKGLSEEDSWRLFRRMTLEEGQEFIDRDLVEIGKGIVRKCANVPLAIKTVGSLLYREDKSTWRSFKNNDLASIEQDEIGIMPILKLSYYHLSPPLKSCFKYCTLFPKNYEIEKDMLINLWMAQGYIVSLDGRSIEDVSEEYFMTLLQRCFFEDVKRDDYGEIITCKLHDLMHVVAQEVAGEEFLVANSNASQFNERIHHISMEELNLSIVSCPAKMNWIRTFLQFQDGYIDKSIADILVSKGKCLRVLDLHHSQIKSLPSIIDDLLHLRYLDLSYNAKLEALPGSITRLCNLQTLNLSHCQQLKALPWNLSELVNLRHLDISHCYKLSHMPPRMNCLSCLQMLTMYVVGGTCHAHNCKQVRYCQLEDLRTLTNLRGSLTIRIEKPSRKDASVTKPRKAGYLISKEHLKEICIEWSYGVTDQRDDDESLLEDFQPHPNIRSFELKGYPGVRFPSWSVLENVRTHPTNIVRISLKDGKMLQYLPSFSQLHHLKTLELCNLENLEYIDSSGGAYATSTSTELTEPDADQSSFFPSLAILRLDNLAKLKGWSKWFGLGLRANQRSFQGGNRKQLLQPSLPRLCELLIWDCPNLTDIPLCPNVEKLVMRRFKDSLLQIISLKEIIHDPSLSSSSDGLPSSQDSAQESMMMESLSRELKSQPKEFDFDEHHFSWLKIRDSNLETLSTFRNVFQSCLLSSRTRSLEILSCHGLKSLAGGGMEHLTALERLRLADLPVLEVDDEDSKGNGFSWKQLCNLHTLALDSLPKLVKLPQGIQCLTSLHSLHISYCKSLNAVPEWIGCLTHLEFLHFDYCPELNSLPESMRKLSSLKRLEIWQCSRDLTERCRQPAGQDWPKIGHIPLVSIHTC